ncbi:ABC transporter substrate-binding protein, partial [Psychrobacillus psychrotolerans]|uniref:ABC transporter substrate-binding protein n=1 Tax=Psychrobacillus psychrotolerans TaxID=126156 RepID=UPI003C7340BE
MKKRWLIAVMAVLLLVGCAQEETKKVESTEAEQAASENIEFPMTLTDAVGEEVRLEAAPEKIISMIPSNTEILFALGLNEEIIGVNDFESYPEEALEKEKIGGMEFNVEKILSLDPDIVFAHESIVG